MSSADPTLSEPVPIDRWALVARHCPRVTSVQPEWPLQVGNGRFAVSVDLTGLQTHPQAYPHHYAGARGTLLGTMSQWGWHSIPPSRPYRLDEAIESYDTPRGPKPYVDLHRRPDPASQVRGTEAEEWLRNNPHRLHLGRIGFVTDTPLDQLHDVEQHLDLWSGVLTSRFRSDAHERRTTVRTAVHPRRDALGVTSDAGWPVRISFPYGSESWALADDWERPEAHRTDLVRLEDGRWRVDRTLDDTHYCVALTTNGDITRTGDHEITIIPTGSHLCLTAEFRSEHQDGPPLTATDVIMESSLSWQEFWESGAALDLSGNDDARAHELERRVVLSQYLTKVNCAGPAPPAETGLLTNSWRGKAHLEMHWWHIAHAALWGRPELIESSLDWYGDIIVGARETAARQGYAGARWPKQVGPEGRESPSDIGTFLLWQQPHPIHLAELVVRAHRARGDDAGAVERQRRWAAIVAATAEFMADVAEPQADGTYGLGPPLVPAQESYGGIRARVTNPAFELTYWRWALLVAQRWRTELGQPPAPHWGRVAEGMRRPHVRDGVMTAIDVEPWTIRTDHPSMLAAHGMVPPVGMVDPSVMRATVADVLADWDWESTWGWDYPVLAMTAARLRLGRTAVEALLMPVTKNIHGPNGHNRQSDRLPAYLPGNGGLLAAVALMAAGWDGGPDRPGFPEDWSVRHEGFVRAPAD